MYIIFYVFMFSSTHLENWFLFFSFHNISLKSGNSFFFDILIVLKHDIVICFDVKGCWPLTFQTTLQRKSYRDLRGEVTRSERMVHCIKGGFVRDRPVTAPNLSQYNTRILEEMRRRESQRAHTALGHRLTALLDRVYKKGRGQTHSTTHILNVYLYTICWCL